MIHMPEGLKIGQEEIARFQKEADLLKFCIRQSPKKVPFRLIEITAPTLPGWGIQQVFEEASRETQAQD